MKKEKLYFTRYYDQWRGKDLELVEDEKNVYDLYIQAPDLDMEEGSINIITASFSTEEGQGIETVGCEIFDSSKRIFKVKIPLGILANNGVYKVSFTVSYNKNGSNKTDEKTAIQTFTIIDSIEIDNSEIENDEKYDILQQLIDELAEYKVDTSNFANKDDVQSMIDKATEGLTIETIKSQLEGSYITPAQIEVMLKNYQTVFGMSEYAKTGDLGAYVKTRYLNENVLPYYVKLVELQKYVMKEEGKTLTSNDLTDALYNKLVNIPEKGVEFDDTELRELIDKKASREFVLELFGDIKSIDLTKYYTIEEIIEIIDNVNRTHSGDINNLENSIENEYLKKEDYEYSDGINTDDVKVNEEQNLTQLIKELQYKEIEIEEFDTTYISNIREIGDTIPYITFNWKLNRTPVSQTLTDSMDDLSSDTRNYTIGNQYTTNKTFTLTVADEKTTKQKSITIQFVRPYLYGTFTENSLALSTLNTGNKIIDIKNNQTIKLTYKDASVFFAYPSVYGELEDIKDNNGLSYFDDFTLQTTSLNGENYNIYILQEKATASNISFSFIFKKEEE